MNRRILVTGVIAIIAFGLGYFLQEYKTPTRPGSTVATSDKIDCASVEGKTKPMPTTKLFFEYNSADEDTGLHGAFDTTSFAELCVYDPTGKQILAVKPQGALKELNMAGIFFESREPKHQEVSQDMHFANFPEGNYSIKAVDFEGYQLTGAATLTHNVPVGPQITSPQDESKVSESDVVVRWKPVTKSTSGKPIKVTGYQVIATKEVNDDPHGFSKPIYDVHVPPTQTSLPIPNEFLEPGAKYELEVLVLEESGNQTISIVFFEIL